MNDKDKEALYNWIDNDVLSQEEINRFKDMTEQERIIFVVERTWQAACEYKQEEIKDIISFQNTEIIHLTKKIDDQDNEYCKDVGYLDDKIRELQAENKKLREALEYIYHSKCAGCNLEEVMAACEEALKEVGKNER